MSITMTDGKTTQTVGESEIVRLRMLEAQGWYEVEEAASVPPPDPPQEPSGDLETQILDNVEALAPDAVEVAKELKRHRKSLSKDDLPTL